MLLATNNKQVTILVYASVCAISLWGDVIARADDLSEPWSVSDQSPVISASARSHPRASRKEFSEEMGKFCSLTWLHIYQNYLSVVMTSHCPMYPSCSHYSQDAIGKYGALKGIMMTADRLIHESTEAREAPVIKIGERMLCSDPVESNILE